MQTYHLSKFGCYRVYSGGGKAISVIQVTYNPNHNILVPYKVFVPLRLPTKKDETSYQYIQCNELELSNDSRLKIKGN